MTTATIIITISNVLFEVPDMFVFVVVDDEFEAEVVVTTAVVAVVDVTFVCVVVTPDVVVVEVAVVGSVVIITDVVVVDVVVVTTFTGFTP
jgi:hypothetical protein